MGRLLSWLVGVPVVVLVLVTTLHDGLDHPSDVHAGGAAQMSVGGASFSSTVRSK